MTCVRGEVPEDCPHFAKGAAPDDAEVSAKDDASAERQLRFPWTGNAMGPADLPYLAGASKLKLLTLAGASDAGKTSLLAAFYLLVARGIRPDGVEFAGSVTLEGWENIAGSLRWTSASGPTFPPHTSTGSGRYPGMLHLALETPQSRCELVAADAPGEWFSYWASNQASPQGAGARWLSERTDVFLVIADSQALAGPDRGQTRVALSNLLRRIGTEAAGRPIALVWTKCDVTVSPEMEARIKDAAQRSLGHFREFRVSMLPAQGEEARNRGQGIVELLQWILSAKPTPVVPEVRDDASRALFQAFGAFA
ncbi:MAG: hypothetical protein IV107_23545 [Paucibacter sp.]|nr:hypothetical protein [Roseateles sp.]